MRHPVVVHVVAHSLPGHTFGETTEVCVGLQVGKTATALIPGDAPAARWETEVTVEDAEDGVRVVRGKAVHGSRRDRFLYLAWMGRTAEACVMFRRAKLHFDAVPAEVMAMVIATGKPLVATLGMTDARGGPICAAVRPPRIVWSVG